METTGLSHGSMDPSLLQQMVHWESLPEEQKLAEASRQFETVFLRKFLSEGLKPMFKGYLDGGGSGSDVYRYMFTSAMADSMSAQGAFQFSSLLQAQLSGGINPDQTVGGNSADTAAANGRENDPRNEPAVASPAKPVP